MWIAELMCSRLCHDLVSPVGAIRNGLELLEDGVEDGGGFAEEAVRLIAHSAEQADRRLRLFRLAYGQAGRQLSSFEDARATIEAWLEGGRSRVVWPQDPELGALADRTGLAKVLLNVLMLADEALPVGGTVTLTGTGSSAAGGLDVTAAGRNAHLPPESLAALAGRTNAETTTARSVHAYATGRFAEAYGFRLSPALGDAMVTFNLTW